MAVQVATTKIKRSTIQNAVQKALAVKPIVLQLDENVWAVASHTHPGHGYVVRRDEEGRVGCFCPAGLSGSYCFHRAAVGLSLHKIPAHLMPAPQAEVQTPEPQQQPQEPTDEATAKPKRTRKAAEPKPEQPVDEKEAAPLRQPAHQG